MDITLEDIKNNSDHYNNKEKLRFLNLLTHGLTVLNRGIWSDTSISEQNQLEALKWSNELMHRFQNFRFELLHYRNDILIRDVIEEIEFFASKSKHLMLNLSPTIKFVWHDFTLVGIERDFEKDCDIDQRFLIMNCIGNQKSPSFLTENGNKVIMDNNMFNVGFSYAYSNIELPRTFDIIFDLNDLSMFCKTKIIVHSNKNVGKWSWTLFKGHHFEGIIEIIGEVPSMFRKLPIFNHNKIASVKVGLCNLENWEIIRNNRASK